MNFFFFVAALFAIIWLWAKYSLYRDDKKKEEHERNLTLRAIDVRYHPEKYLEQGELKNGWALVKLTERRFAYIKPIGKTQVMMRPDDNPYQMSYLYDNNNLFEAAEEFNYESAIVKRKGQSALLHCSGKYLIPFASVPLHQTIESSMSDIGEGLLIFYQSYYKDGGHTVIKSSKRIYNRLGKIIYDKDDYTNARVEKGKLILSIRRFSFEEPETMVLDSSSGRILLPWHVVSYALNNGNIMYYSRLGSERGWNVFDTKNHIKFFSKFHEGIAFLEGKNNYVLLDQTVSIADASAKILCQLPQYADKVYDEEYFHHSGVLMNYDGEIIAEEKDGLLEVLFSKQEEESSYVTMGRTGYEEKKPKLPFRKGKHPKPLYVKIRKDNNISILDLTGKTIFSTEGYDVELEFGLLDNKPDRFRVRSKDLSMWSIYDLNGKHIKDEPYRREDLFEFDNGYSEYIENERILMDGYFDYLEEQKELARAFEEDDYDFFEGRPRHSYNPFSRPSSSTNPKATIQKPVKTPNKYLFFDTETTGLPVNYNAPITDLDNWPRLVQLSWILTDSEGKELRIKDFIIKPDGYTIPDESTKVHGISTEIAQREGSSLSTVLSEFISDLESADSIVGHNIDFDKKVIGAEFIRAGMNEGKLSKPTICTMKSSTDYCKIPGKYGYKWPTLQELYNILFSENFDDAHNSLNDIKATKKCFFELVGRGIIRKEF